MSGEGYTFFFYNVELLYPLDEFQTIYIFYRGNIKHKHHFYRVTDTIKVMFLFYVALSNFFKTRYMLLLLFCLNKGQFWLLIMLRTFSVIAWQKKTLQENANCSAPKTVIGVTKVANERYLLYLKKFGKVFCEFHKIYQILEVKVAQF